jgi:hypothetical protein
MNWKTVLLNVGLGALKASPLAPIAEPVTAAIAEAQQFKGASGKEKLAHVLAVATDAAAAAQKAGLSIDPAMVAAAGEKAISTAVDVTNIVHRAHEHEPEPPAAVPAAVSNTPGA